MKKTYEELDGEVTAIWEMYVAVPDYPYADAEIAVANAVHNAGWTIEEYDDEVVARWDEPGCRLAAERNCNA